MEKVVYTVEDVKRLLGIGDTVARREIRSGNIPAKKIGGRYLIPKELFDNWLKEQTA